VNLRERHHVMIDVETLGRSSRAPLVSMAAVYFCSTSTDMYREISYWRSGAIAASLAPPFEPDFDTVRWWMQQSDAARQVFTKEPPGALAQTMLHFLSWWEYERINEPVVWAKPPRFDITIVEHALQTCGLNAPWAHRNVLDMRTLVAALDPSGALKPVDGGTKHDALDDARHQARYVMRLLEETKS